MWSVVELQETKTLLSNKDKKKKKKNFFLSFLWASLDPKCCFLGTLYIQYITDGI